MGGWCALSKCSLPKLSNSQSIGELQNPTVIIFDYFSFLFLRLKDIGLQLVPKVLSYERSKKVLKTSFSDGQSDQGFTEATISE